MCHKKFHPAVQNKIFKPDLMIQAYYLSSSGALELPQKQTCREKQNKTGKTKCDITLAALELVM